MFPSEFINNARSETMGGRELCSLQPSMARSVNQLPDKVGEKIFSLISVIDLANCACVSKDWKNLSAKRDVNWSDIGRSFFSSLLYDNGKRKETRVSENYIKDKHVKYCISKYLRNSDKEGWLGFEANLQLRRIGHYSLEKVKNVAAVLEGDAQVNAWNELATDLIREGKRDEVIEIINTKLSTHGALKFYVLYNTIDYFFDAYRIKKGFEFYQAKKENLEDSSGFKIHKVEAVLCGMLIKHAMSILQFNFAEKMIDHFCFHVWGNVSSALLKVEIKKSEKIIFDGLARLKPEFQENLYEKLQDGFANIYSKLESIELEKQQISCSKITDVIPQKVESNFAGIIDTAEDFYDQL